LVLIDTNVWSELARPRPNPNVEAWVAKHSNVCILSAIVFAEMQYGIALAEPPRRDEVQAFVDTVLIRLTDGIAPFGAEAAQAWGTLRARLQQAGELIGERDMLIAAHAIALGVPLVTRDVLDMARTGATIINPWEP
jgi:toxin FitB